MPDRDEPFDTLPPAIVEALHELDGPAVLPDPARDADVLSGARRHLADNAAINRKRRNLRLFFAGGAGGAVAAAAMVGVVVLVGDPAGRQPMNQPASPMADQAYGLSEERIHPLTPGDVNADGTLNILDAYALAKQVDAGTTFYYPGHDLNGDGLIDQADIDLIASQAVALNSGGQG